MIPEYRNILYATDLSPNSAQAFRHAVSLARRYDGAIHILHVLPPTGQAVVNYVATVMGEERLADLEMEHEDEVVRSILERLDEFTRAELPDHPEDRQRVQSIEVTHGEPAERILEAADRLEADLIVVGSHGKGRLRHVLLGSVAEKVLHRSTRPVLASRLFERRSGDR